MTSHNEYGSGVYGAGVYGVSGPARVTNVLNRSGAYAVQIAAVMRAGGQSWNHDRRRGYGVCRPRI